MRAHGRERDQLRELTLERGFTRSSPGSVLGRAGRTMVLCTVNIEDGVPPFLLNTNKGWLTAEYSMLPGSAGGRRPREGRRPQPDARALEIGRLIGRTLRASLNLARLPGRTAWVDCDVLQADGGTRTLAVTAAMVALIDALRHSESKGWTRSWPVVSPIAAISAGLVNGEALLDLDYAEDSRAEVDLNVVMNASGEFVEIQSTAEQGSMTHDQLQTLLGLCSGGIEQIRALQQQALGEAW